MLLWVGGGRYMLKRCNDVHVLYAVHRFTWIYFLGICSFQKNTLAPWVDRYLFLLIAHIIKLKKIIT